MGKGRPFLEVFASALRENYRFPILEIFAFLYAFATFVFAGAQTSVARTSEIFAHNMVNSLTGAPLFVLVVLILVNIAYGLGGDLERGVVQTLLSYPLKRRHILAAKLLSALGVTLLLFLGMQMFALSVLEPDTVLSHFNAILLSYLADLGPVVLTAGIVLLLALFLRRGGLALVVGIVTYFTLGIIAQTVIVLGWSGSDLPLKAYGVFAPNMVLDRYYAALASPSNYSGIWVPSFSEVLFYVGAAYVLVGLVFLVGFIYFDRRLGI